MEIMIPAPRSSSAIPGQRPEKGFHPEGASLRPPQLLPGPLERGAYGEEVQELLATIRGDQRE